MAAPRTKRFATLVADFAAAAQAASTAALDFSVGSVFRALAEATGGVATWLQKLYLFALSITRLQTSQGVWVDTYVGDFALTRLPAVAATGLATLSRSTATAQAVVPVGTSIATQDGTQTFTVTADTSNSAYGATVAPGGKPGYAVAAGVQTLTVPAAADVAGTGGNVNANTITALRSAVLGIDAVTNATAFTTGQDAETDAALKARFKLYIASLARATAPAIGYALTSLQQGVQYTITENAQHSGTPDNGYLTIVVDDGTGAPSSVLLAAAVIAVDSYRAAGVRFGVFAPSVVNVTVSCTITTATGYGHSALVAQVAAALAAYINGLGLGTTLRWSRLEQVAYDVSPGITNVASLLVNGGTADVSATALTTIKCSGSPTVS